MLRRVTTYHPRFVAHIVIDRYIRDIFNRQLEVPVFRCRLMRIVPLQIVLETVVSCPLGFLHIASTHCTPIMQILSLPVWIIPWPKRPPILVELIRKHENQLLSRISIRLLRVRLLRRVPIYQSIVSGEFRYLPRGVDSTQIETALP